MTVSAKNLSLEIISPPKLKRLTKCDEKIAGRLRGLAGSALDHRSPPPEFESRRWLIRRVIDLSLRFITFGGRSTHLPYTMCTKVSVKHQSSLSSEKIVARIHICLPNQSFLRAFWRNRCMRATFEPF